MILLYGIRGAVYEIVAAEDIVTPDGTVRNTKGEVVDTVTTDENGVAKSRGRSVLLYIKKPYPSVQLCIFAIRKRKSG